MKKIIKTLVVLVLVLYTVNIYAQNSVQPGDVDPQGGSSCLDLSTNLRYKDTDLRNSGQVSLLQDFLIYQGYMTGNPTGYFGLVTLNAVKKFQKDNNFSPTGFVGPLTKAKIKDITCNSNNGSNNGGTTTVENGGSNLPTGCSSTVGYSYLTGEKCTGQVSIRPVISYVQAYAEDNNVIHVGEKTRIIGNNFPTDATVTVFIDKYSISGKTNSIGTDVTFFVPNIPAGSYGVYVATDKGVVSNTVYVTVKSSTSNANTIGIITPKQGDVVSVGIPVRIDWVAFGNVDNSAIYDITLFADNGKGNIADGVTQAQAGCLGYGKGVCSYIWTPNSASSKTQITVSKRGTTEIGYSGSFSVVSKTNQPSITVTSPNGGERFQNGTTRTITWNTANLPSDARLEIDLANETGSYLQTVIASSIPNTGSYSWVIPIDFKFGEGNHKILISSLPAGKGSVQDFSDSYFTFFYPNSSAVLTVSSPAQPSSTIAPKNAARIPFTKFTVSATGGDVVLNSIFVQREGTAPDSVLSSVVLLDEYEQPVGLPNTLNYNHQVLLGGKLTIKDGTSRTLTIAGSMASDLSASAGKTVSLSLVGVNTLSVVSGQLPITGASHIVNNTLNIGTLSYTKVNKGIVNGNTVYDLAFTAGSVEGVRLKGFILQNDSWYGTITVRETGASYYCSRTLFGTTYCDFGSGLLIGKGLTVTLGSNRLGGFDVVPQPSDIYVLGEVYSFGIIPVFVPSVSNNTSPKIVGFPSIPANISVGQMVNFNFTAKDSDNDDLAWSFEFGDGFGVADACSVSRPRSGKGANMTIGHVWNNSGIYQFSAKVYDCQGGSDFYKFSVNVGSLTNNLPPVINGVDAPITLNVGQTGTWTVRASDPENGNLSYSVVWGDEQNYVAMGASSVSSAPFVQSSTFTHSYATAGTYTVSISVKDNVGQITKTSTTVRVTNSVVQPSITVLSPNGGEVWNANTDNVISWKHENSLRGPAYAYLQFQDGSKCFLGGGKDVTYSTMSINISKLACVNTLKQIPSGQYKILVSVGDGWDSVSTEKKDASDNFFTVNGVSDDNSTASATISVVTESTKDDKAGSWHVFSPNGYPDMNWTMTLNVTGGQKTVKSISIFNSSNGWGTNLDNLDIGKGHYPLVVLQNGSQLVDSYNRVLGTYSTGTYTFKLYGDGAGYYPNLKAVVRFVDGTSVTGDVDSIVVRKYTDDEIVMYLEQATRNRTKGPFSPATEIDFDMNNDRLVNATDQIIIRSIKTIPDEKFDLAYKRIVRILDSQVGKIKMDSGFIDELDVDRNGTISLQDKADILRVITGNRVYPPVVQYPITFSNSSIVTGQNILVNVPNQILGGFEVNNAGNESVEINRISFTVKVSGNGGVAEEITNVSLFDSSSNVVAGPVDTGISDAVISFSDTFVVPVGKSTFYIKGKLGSKFVNGQTVYLYSPEIGVPKGSVTRKDYAIPADSFTLSRMTVRTASLSISAGSSSVMQNITAGSQGIIFTNFQFDATQSSEDVRIVSIPVHLTYTEGLGNELSFCQLYDGNVAITTGLNIVNPNVSPSSASYKFNLDQPVTVVKGSTKTLSVKCNVAISAKSFVGHFDVTTSDAASVSAYATVSGSSVVPAGSAIGNTMTVIGPVVVAMTDVEIISLLEATIRKYPCTFLTFSQGTCKLNFDLGGDNRVDLSDEIMMRNVLTLSDAQFDSVYKKIIAEVDSRVGSVAGNTNFEIGFDVNRDGTINANDKASIIKAIVGTRSYTSSI